MAKKKTKHIVAGGREETAGAAARHSGEAVDYQDAERLSTFLLEILRRANRPLRMDELLRISHLPRKAKKKAETALFRMQDEGRVLRAGGGWAAPARMRHAEGVLSVQQAGVGFVTPAKGGPDIYVHPAAMGDAWHGDTVEVLILPGRRGPSAEGRIVRVLRRGLAEIPVHAVKRHKDGQWLCAPANPRIQALFVTDVSGLKGRDSSARAVDFGDLLLIRPGEKAGAHLWQAEATANLEHEESPAAQERLTKSNHAIPGPFPPAVLEAVKTLPDDPEESDFSGRHDLRSVPFVTIDGRAARDFDDAIHVEAAASGFRLRVAIADVSHYVRPGTALDAEARLRGNSYYFPLSVEPMLPEALSNGLCSLKPDLPRLAVVADLRFSAEGSRLGADFYPAVIVSKARLTYGQVQRGLLLGEEEEAQRLEAHLPMLRQAEALARQLLSLRGERGSLDFDLPEAEYCFDPEGALTAVVPRERHFGHRIIEECMIAANEAVASFLEKKEQPCLYRVHEPPDPDKLTSLLDFLSSAGLGEQLPPARPGKGKGKASPVLGSGRALRRILAEAESTPQAYTVTRLVLRAMMQARYQTENTGHFGLASVCYCHFTSPIRRYADLAVHRALKQALGLSMEDKPLSAARLEAIGEHLNATERNAMEAEREIGKRLSVLLLRDKVGEVCAGVISGVTDFGIFVELPAHMAEGMVRLSSLEDDYYEFIPERQELRGRRLGTIFHLGMPVTARILDISLGRQEINLVLESVEGPRKKAKKRPGKRA